MKKQNDSLKFLGAVLLAGILMYFILTVDFDFKTFSVVQDVETQLKSQYTPFFSDATDHQFNFANCRDNLDDATYEIEYQKIRQQGFGCISKINNPRYYEDDKFICSGFGTATPQPNAGFDALGIQASQARTFQCTTKQDFKGQEVAIYGYFAGTEGGSCGIRADNNGIGLPRGNPELVILKPRRDIGTYDVIRNGITEKEINVGVLPLLIKCEASSLRGADISAVMNFIGTKPRFCQKSDDEVWVQDRFLQDFTIDDLSFKGVTGLCQETRPMELEIFGEGAIKLDERDGFNLLLSKKTINVEESKEAITVNYITPFVSGVLNRCANNQGNVCTQRDANGKCIGNWICQDVEKENIIIQQCNENIKCFQPSSCKEPIPCVNNFCDYSKFDAVCRNEVVTIIKEKEQLKETETVFVSGNNVFNFNVPYSSKSFMFGDKQFIGGVEFTCSLPPEGEHYSFPNPQESCYKGIINFDGKNLEVKHKDKVSLTPNIDVQFFASGTIRNREDSSKNKAELNGNFVFTITNPLDLQVMGNRELLLNSDSKITFKIKNNLPTGTVILRVRVIDELTGKPLEETSQRLAAINGESSVDFKPDTSRLGIKQYSIKDFYAINIDGNEILIGSGFERTLSLNIVNQIVPEQPKTIIVHKETEKKTDCRDYGCSSGFSCSKFNEGYVCKQENLFQRFLRFLKSLFGG